MQGGQPRKGQARDMGHVDAEGQVKPPLEWDEGRRRMLRAKLEAVFFHIYRAMERDDVRYGYSRFDIIATHGRYLPCDLCLAYTNTPAAGDPNADMKLVD